MKAKEEAIELVERFLDFIPCNDNELSEDDMYNYQLENAKQCALICVDEMLEFAYDIEWEKKEEAVSRLKFLKEVKQEIEKL